MYLTYLVLLGLTIILNSVLLVIFYLRANRNYATVSLFVMLFLVNMWFLPKFLTNAFHAHGFLFETLSRISALGYIFVPVALVLFCLFYGGYQKLLRKLYFWILLIVPPVIFLYLSWTSNLVGVHDASTAKLYPWGYETPTGKLWLPYIIWYDAVALFAVGVLINYYYTMIDQSKKKQTLYFILAIFIPLVINDILVGILPVFNIFIFPIGLILIAAVTIIGISLIYHNSWLEVSPFIILSNINHVILTVDPNGRILQINSSAEKLLKMKTSQLVGKPLDKILLVRHGENKKSNNFMYLLKSTLARGKSMTFNSFSVYINKKQKLTKTISITPIYSQSEIIGANILLRDTRKEEVYEKNKDDYFSMVFHELKTPITSIKAYNQLLLMKLKNSTDENKLLAFKMDKQLDKLTKLINDFYELSRANTGKLTLKKEVFAVNDFVRGVIDTATIAHKDRLISLKGSTSCMVYADKDKIEQILINLINNAVKFSPENKEITVHLQGDTKKVTIGVQDYGKGIDPKFHKRVFHRFFQIGMVPKEKMGLGVGLFIASTIVRAHRGHIWVNSKLGKGSTFYFSLPANNI